MARWTRVRADLSRPEVPTGRDQLPFLVGAALTVTVIAQLTDPGGAVDLLLLAPAVGAFVLRGLVARLPGEVFAALVLGPVVLVISRGAVLEGALFLTELMMLYVAWHSGSWLRPVAVLAATAAAPLLLAEVLVPAEGIAWSPWSSASVLTFALGRLLRRQQALIDALGQARDALAEQAVAEERRRIARELHDLAGHTLAAMLLHVTGARHVLRRDLDEAERALVDAETVGRGSLEVIRATVAALRTHERGTDRALAGSADIGELVEEYRRAGLALEATVAAAVTELDGAVGTAVHRIAREALANVARHAPENSVELVIDVDHGAVHLVVADRGRAAVAADPDGRHFGLVGMGERARALGGELQAGPTADGWRVDARLPITVAVPTP